MRQRHREWQQGSVLTLDISGTERDHNLVSFYSNFDRGKGPSPTRGHRRKNRICPEDHRFGCDEFGVPMKALGEVLSMHIDVDA